MFKRELYLKCLISSLDNGLIKVISGIRRAGKSFLLNNIFYNYLLEKGINKKNIIKFAFDSANDLALIDVDIIALKKENKKVPYKNFISFIDKNTNDKENIICYLMKYNYLKVLNMFLMGI